MASLTRGFCKSEWMKPKFVHTPYSERLDLPLFVQTTRRHDYMRCGEITKSWYSKQRDLCKIFNTNGSMQRVFASLGVFDCGNDSTNADKSVDNVNDEDNLKKRHVKAIIRTYSELQELNTSDKISVNLAHVESLYDTATLNATTASLDDDEKLKQKMENIDEVPLVEADPDIIKPPRTSGPNIMNVSRLSNWEEDARNSDFQIGEDHYQREQSVEETVDGNRIRNYFERESSRKPNLNDMVTLHAVPELKTDEELSLKELMERVRQRNRCLRCRDINHQLNTTTVDDFDRNRPQVPINAPTIQPGWGWPQSPMTPSFRPAPSWPQVSNPSPQKAEPITPDSRPGYHPRASKVDPVTLALHLGPLVTAFKSATVLFPIMSAYLLPMMNPSIEASDDIPRNFNCILNEYDHPDEVPEATIN